MFYNIVSDNTPPLISDLAMWRESQYNLRGHKKATVPRFSTHFMKHSIRFRGAVLWNFASDYLNDSHNFNRDKPELNSIQYSLIIFNRKALEMCTYEIEKNNCFSIYTGSDLNNIFRRKPSKIDLIDLSIHAWKTCKRYKACANSRNALFTR